VAIRKQEYYEGAALYQLARAGGIRGLKWEAPFFLVNQKHAILFKYSTAKRSPWAFTFTVDEQEALVRSSAVMDTVAALTCGNDGVVPVRLADLKGVTSTFGKAFRISCSRSHGGHYTMSGPDGEQRLRIAPADWRRLLEGEQP